MGAAVAIYSLMTDYGSDKPWGGVRVLSMKQHLQLDAAFGLWVGLSPWVFGTYKKGWNYWAPQTLAMTSELFFALTTELDPDYVPPHVLVLGGGYVPITLTRALRRAVERGELDVTVVSRDNFHTFHGFVGEMITGRIGPSSMLSPVRRIFAPAKVHVAEIESIDLDARKVVTSRHLDGARFDLEYDHLVLCLGSSENLDAYPGLAEHAFKLKTFKDCLALKNHILEMFELADIERDPAERRRLLTFVVAGGGYAGNGDRGRARRLRPAADEARVLGHPPRRVPRRDRPPGADAAAGAVRLAERRGPGTRQGLREARRVRDEALAQARRRAAARDPRRGRDAARRLPLERRARADADDRQRRRDGGAAALRHDRDPAERAGPRAHGRDACASRASRTCGPGETAPLCLTPTAAPARRSASTRSSTARGSARTCAESSRGKEPEPFRYPGLGQGVSIGRRTAVGELKGIPIRGLFCWIVWRSMLFYFFPTWDRRLRLLADWSIWPLVGRDIVQLGRGDHGEYEILHHVYQPGQVIAERARPVRHVHVIVEGEVELVTGEEIVENLRAGDHFGRKSIELSRADTARARTLVRTVALRADQANELQDMLLSTERIVARTGTFQTIRPEDIAPPG